MYMSQTKLATKKKIMATGSDLYISLLHKNGSRKIFSTFHNSKIIMLQYLVMLLCHVISYWVFKKLLTSLYRKKYFIFWNKYGFNWIKVKKNQTNSINIKKRWCNAVLNMTRELPCLRLLGEQKLLFQLSMLNTR